MFQIIRKSRLVQIILAVVALIVVGYFVGYFSSAITLNACEKATSQWVADQISNSTWPPRRAYAQAAELDLPWLVGVDYHFARSSKGGESGTRYYLCLFGLPIPVKKKVRMMS